MRFPTLYIPHGAGPCFFMEWTLGPRDSFFKMEAWLRSVADGLGVRPRAVLVISAHWESSPLTVTGGASPGLIYDYYGFPEHTYQITYPAPGEPDLAKQVASLLVDAGLETRIDEDRGFDHGVFIPLKLIYPDASVPVVQLSLDAELDSDRHLQIGRALAPLRDQKVLIIGSGFSYHNLSRLMSGSEELEDSEQFDQWLSVACQSPDQQRDQALKAWSDAPRAGEAHPRAEHLLPLMVVAGAAGIDTGVQVFNDRVMGAVVSGWRFGSIH